jgi:hypothetical protein
VNLIMKYLIAILSLIGVGCQPAYAEQSIDWYGKIAYNYIVEQPTIKGTYEFQNNSYSVEYGIEIDPDGASSYRFGLYWFDQIGMDKVSKGRYEPKYLEVFGERAYNVGDWYGRIGWGYKAYQDAYINNIGSPSSQVIKSPLDRVTARFAIGKKIGQWEVGLGHNSNWFVNKPFDSRWEYHQTSISIGYVF